MSVEKTLSGRRGVAELEIDAQQLLKEQGGDGDLGNRVTCVGDDTRRKVQPVVAETTNRFLLPFRAEVVTFQQLDQCEGEQADSKVETVG